MARVLVGYKHEYEVTYAVANGVQREVGRKLVRSIPVYEDVPDPAPAVSASSEQLRASVQSMRAAAGLGVAQVTGQSTDQRAQVTSQFSSRRGAQMPAQHAQRRMPKPAEPIQPLAPLPVAPPQSASGHRQAEATNRHHVADEQRKAVSDYGATVADALETAKRTLGYIPPHDSPLLVTRALRHAVAELRRQWTPGSDAGMDAAIAEAEREIGARFSLSDDFVRRLRERLAPSHSLVERLKSRARRLTTGHHQLLDRAEIQLELPQEVDDVLRGRMARTEAFLGSGWGLARPSGAIFAVHEDKLGPATFVQIGIAEHGPLVIRIPGLLGSQAEATIRELLRRLEPFAGAADPMAVINGDHQAMNYNRLVAGGRVIRAPSGDTERLRANLEIAFARPRMEPENTAILNSAPATVEEYRAVFPGDAAAASWATWSSVAPAWSGSATREGFAVGAEASRDALLQALATKQNVIVVVSHCDKEEETIYLPHPPPGGTQVSRADLEARRAEIEANKPFVLLFACEAGDMDGTTSFARALLDCGACGVVAAQTKVDDAFRRYLERLLDQQRGAPPLEDVWDAMRQTNLYEMEAFLA